MDNAVIQKPMLTVNQRKSLDALGLDESLQSFGDRPEFDAELATQLRQVLEDGLRPVVDSHGYTKSDALVLSKYDLATVFACEGLFLASKDEPFEWSIAKAKGTVLHKVQQVGITPRGANLASPVAVEQAVDRLRKDPDSSMAAWLEERTEFEIAELIAEVTELAVKIRSDLPPIQPQWQPRPESRVRAELCEGQCILLGKVDLALGSPRGLQARTFILDYKTGAKRYEHADEIRFYALLETLRSGTPPWRTAVYYVDLGEWLTLDITEGDLEAAARRAIDGAAKVAALSRNEREPNLTPGPCSFCPALQSCTEGKAHLSSKRGPSG